MAYGNGGIREVQVSGSDIAEAYEDTGADYGGETEAGGGKDRRIWDCRVSGDVGGGDVITLNRK